MACRACLKVAVVFAVLLLYLVLWYTTAEGVFWLTGGTCLFSVFAAPFLIPACAAGVAGSLLRGLHFGTGPLKFDVQWNAR
jgi:hypothetical protein